jgi:hypothetical protein
MTQLDITFPLAQPLSVLAMISAIGKEIRDIFVPRQNERIILLSKISSVLPAHRMGRYFSISKSLT